MTQDLMTRKEYDELMTARRAAAVGVAKQPSQGLMTREEYLTARAAWRADYAAFTVTMREAKAARRDTAREYSKNPEDSKLRRKTSDAAYAIIGLKKLANKKLEERQALKFEAQRAWIAQEHVA